MEEGVLTLNNTGQGNNYVASSTQSGAFVFETTMSYQEGATADAGLLFGAPAQEMEPAAGGWYGAMVNNGEARVFCERGADTLNVVAPIPNSSELDYENLRLKLTVDAAKNVEFYVNDMENPVISTTAPSFAGGYVGFVGYNRSVKYSDFPLLTIPMPRSRAILTPTSKVNGRPPAVSGWRRRTASWLTTGAPVTSFICHN